jgi:hypothetical protein
MSHRFGRRIAATLCFISLLISSTYLSAQNTVQQPIIPILELRELRAALSQLEAYLGTGPNGQAWREFC